MKKVLLFDTALATSNVGDEIIYDSTKEGLKPIIYNAAVYRMATHVQNYSAFQMFLHRHLYADVKIKQINEQADYKFICGTNLLVPDLFRPRAQLMLNSSNKSLYYNAVLVGVGRIRDYSKFKNRYTVNLYKKVLSDTYLHSVRDEATKKVLEDIGIRCINTGCPTLWMMTEEKCKSIPRKKSENVIFSLSGYDKQRNPQKDKQLVACLLRNYEFLYAWIQTTADEDYVREMLDNSERVQFIYSLACFAEILNKGNIDYIGTRLHGGIYALQHNVRSVIIAIDERALGFYESNNLPILRREEISKLDDLINGEIVTDIRLNTAGIEEFLHQFV